MSGEDLQTRTRLAKRLWYGQDHKDRVLRLMLVFENHMVVVSAAEATPNQKARYLEEDQEGLAQDEEGSEDLRPAKLKKE